MKTKVQLFITCITDVMYASVGQATVEVLEHYGCDVSFPEQQSCCGQPTYNSGYVEDTKALMKHMIEAFEGDSYVVSPSGSCIYMLKEYPHILKDDPEWYPRAIDLANRAYEVTDFIINVLGVKQFEGYFPHKVTLHKSCHMTRLLGVAEEPTFVLTNIEGIEYTPLKYPYNCCGFGGTFSIKMPHISGAMVDEKAHDIMKTDAEYLVGNDMACLLNISGKLNRLGSQIQPVHLMVLLRDALLAKKQQKVGV